MRRRGVDALASAEPLVQSWLLRLLVFSEGGRLRGGESLVQGDPAPSEILLWKHTSAPLRRAFRATGPPPVPVLTFDMVHQGDDLLGEGAAVCRGLAVRPRVLQQGQEVQTLAPHADQV